MKGNISLFCRGGKYSSYCCRKKAISPPAAGESLSSCCSGENPCSTCSGENLSSCCSGERQHLVVTVPTCQLASCAVDQLCSFLKTFCSFLKTLCSEKSCAVDQLCSCAVRKVGRAMHHRLKPPPCYPSLPSHVPCCQISRELRTFHGVNLVWKDLLCLKDIATLAKTTPLLSPLLPLTHM